MIRLLTGDCRDMLQTLPANSVHCVITSPPYYGLRDYGTAQWEGGDVNCQHAMPVSYRSSTLGASTGGRSEETHQRSIGAQATPYRHTCGKCGARRIDQQLGLEATPDEYLATMVQVFREVRRVLRDDGTCWVNMGDSYATQPAGNLHPSDAKRGPASYRRSNIAMDTTRVAKPKDLLMMPSRLALALQADGWWLRSDIIWAKPNPMPESVTDRPTNAHEHVFLLTKRSRYFYDADAVREEATTFERQNTSGVQSPKVLALKAAGFHGEGGSLGINYERSARNLRNVWTVATAPFPAAHFATFPPELAERCIRAGTSERGCCAQCGKPWVRQVEKWPSPPAMAHRGGNRAPGSAYDGSGSVRHSNGQEFAAWKGQHPDITTGWSPGCQCNAEVAPCVVLDCFSGAGTALLVADRLGRDAIGIDLSHQYVSMARDRLQADCPLFADISCEETERRRGNAPVPEPPERERMADLFAEAAE